MTERQWSIWLLSMASTSEVNDSLYDHTGISYSSSEQHKDLCKAHVTLDTKDIYDFVAHLQDRNPITSDPCLCSIATGIIADNSCNVAKAKDVGKRVLELM